MLVENYIEDYKINGLFKIPELLDKDTATKLATVVDQLMMGERKLGGMFFQMDPNSDSYGDVNFNVTSWQGPSLNYRKIKDLEYVPEFLGAIQNSALRQIATRIIGPDVSSMRMMIVNKPSKSKTPLPWHQDISSKWPMSGMPELTVWIALDEVNKDNGCVEWLKGSHKLGEVEGGHLTSDEKVDEILRNHEVYYGELGPGDAVVFNNGVLHRSNPNYSGFRRRGLTLCLMDARIFNTDTKTFYPVMFGSEEIQLRDIRDLEEIPANRPIDFGE